MGGTRLVASGPCRRQVSIGGPGGGTAFAATAVGLEAGSAARQQAVGRLERGDGSSCRSSKQGEGGARGAPPSALPGRPRDHQAVPSSEPVPVRLNQHRGKASAGHGPHRRA